MYCMEIRSVLMIAKKGPLFIALRNNQKIIIIKVYDK